MNSSPNHSQPQTNRAGADREPKPNAEIGSKLKEAEAKLFEAEAKLMDDPNAKPTPSGAAPANANANTDANANERRAPASDKASAEAKEHAPKEPLSAHLSEGVAGMLSYLFGWVTGLLFLLIDRRPFVRYHAAQSVAVFATLSIVLLALSGFFLGAAFPSLGGPLLIARRLVELIWLIATVILMLKAVAGEKSRIGIASEYADRAAHGAK